MKVLGAHRASPIMFGTGGQKFEFMQHLSNMLYLLSNERLRANLVMTLHRRMDFDNSRMGCETTG